VYQDQKVYLFRSSLSFLAEAQPRLENRRGQKTLLAEVHIKFFRRSQGLQSTTDIIGKITNLFFIYLFKYIDKFINTY
jgi:hypothetical protein